MQSFKRGNTKIWLFQISKKEWLFTREVNGKATKIIPFPNERSANLHYQTEVLNINTLQKAG